MYGMTSGGKGRRIMHDNNEIMREEGRTGGSDGVV